MATLTEGVLGGGLRGRSGNAVFVRTPRGTVVRERTIPHDPQSDAQRAVRAAQGRASAAWKNLDPPAVALWTAYARGLGMQPNNAFTNLYKVLLRLDPAAPVPLVPPARAFLGDAVMVEVAPATGDPGTSEPLPLGRGRGGVEGVAEARRQAQGGTTPSLPSPGGDESPVVSFSASGPNAPGVVTELLLQPLVSRNRRTYLERYRHAAYHAFAAGEVLAVPCEAGWTACAYRFVNAGTGQVTALAELGVVLAG